MSEKQKERGKEPPIKEKETTHNSRTTTEPNATKSCEFLEHLDSVVVQSFVRKDRPEAGRDPRWVVGARDPFTIDMRAPSMAR